MKNALVWLKVSLVLLMLVVLTVQRLTIKEKDSEIDSLKKDIAIKEMSIEGYKKTLDILIESEEIKRKINESVTSKLNNISISYNSLSEELEALINKEKECNPDKIPTVIVVDSKDEEKSKKAIDDFKRKEKERAKDISNSIDRAWCLMDGKSEEECR